MLSIFYYILPKLFQPIPKRSFQLYHETRWDPLVRDKEIEKPDRLNHILAVSGHFRSHEIEDEPTEFEKFGDISIITLNLYREVVVDSETLQSAENIRTILDEAHPTFLCLQGVDDSLLLRINGKLKDNEHYKLANFDKYDVDNLSGQRDYFPIIYDSALVFPKNSGYFETEGAHKQKYASFLEVKDLRNKADPVSFTVINAEMYSSFNDVVSAEFSNIVSDIASYKEVDKHPVFIAGGMGTLPPNVKELMKSTYKNSIEEDANNTDIPKTTVHSGGQDDDVQRDFILLRDANKIFKLNYARILREFLASDHYPVHAIYSYTHRPKEDKPKPDPKALAQGLTPMDKK